MNTNSFHAPRRRGVALVLLLLAAALLTSGSLLARADTPRNVQADAQIVRLETLDRAGLSPDTALDATLNVGETLTWLNGDADEHDLVATDGSFRSSTLARDEAYSFSFEEAGIYDYICAVDPEMRGTITVAQQDDDGPDGTPDDVPGAGSAAGNVFLPLVNAGSRDDSDDSDYATPPPGPTDVPGPAPTTNTTVALRTDASGATAGFLTAGDLTGRAGMALYRFAEDEERLAASACSGECAGAWPPLTVANRAALAAPAGLPLPLDVVERADGSLQVTYGGWPLYFYAGDEAPGDANGHRVGDVWWLAAVEAPAVEEFASGAAILTARPSARPSVAALGFTGEAGQIEVSQASADEWHAVSLENSYADPVVLMQPLSQNSRMPAMVRLRNVSGSGFEFQIDEWDYQNGHHPVETVSYLVVEAGVQQLGDQRLEAGQVDATHDWRRVNLGDGFGDAPVVLSQMQTMNDSQAAVTRQRGVSAAGFELRVQEEEASDNAHGAETVGYVAISTGSGELGGAPFEVARTPDKVNDGWFALGFAQRYSQPLFFADMQTFDGPDTANLRYQALGESGAQIRVHEETSRDGETWHTTEVAGYLVLAADFGANQPPKATISAAPLDGFAPLEVTFDGAQSADPDGSITTYAWTFGDGASSTEPAPTHTYTEPGAYVVTLAVMDSGGATSATSATIGVRAAPEPTPGPTAEPTSDPTPTPPPGTTPGATPAPPAPGTPAPTPDPGLTSERWSDAATWGGSVPGENAAVTIPAGKRVLLDVNPPALRSLTVEGELIVENRDLTLTVGWIMVRGLMEMGTPDAPYTANATITLNGATGDNVMNMGARVFGVMNGTLRLHAQTPTSWLKLNETAPVGATELVLERNPGWQVGDEIVIASSDFDYRQDETATITAVSGSRITLDAPLEYMHWGALQSYGGHEIDQRTEIGLLSRNVTIQGPESAGSDNGLGGHLMVMGQSHLHLHGVELKRMGQAGGTGRYPVHFHLAGDGVRGSTIEASTIRDTFNRCLTIHGSNGITVKNVVAFNAPGHCFFLEDGAEIDNVFENNLGLGIRRPEDGNRLLDSDRDPSVYWITHPNNTFINNVAAGSEGRGFWIALPEHPTGPSKTAENDANVWNRREQFAPFVGNVGHSNNNDALHVDRGPTGDVAGNTETTVHVALENPLDDDSAPVTSVFENFVAYKNRNRGVWLRGGYHVLESPILADNAIGATFASYESVVRNGLFIGETANVGTTEPWMTDEMKGEGGRSLPRFYEPDYQIRGFEYYDGNVGAEDSYFAQYAPTGQRQASALGIFDFTGFEMNPKNWASGLTFADGTQRFYAQTRPNPADPTEGSEDGYRSAVILDRDGSVNGTANRYLTVDNELLLTDSCTKRDDWNMWICDEQYVGLQVQTDGNELASVSFARNGAVHTTFGTGSAPGNNFRTSLLAGTPHTLTFDANIPNRFRLVLRDGEGLSTHVQIPNYTQYPKVLRYGRELTPVHSLAALGEQTEPGFYYDTVNATLHVRIVANGGYEALEIEQNGPPPPVTGSGTGLTGAYYDNVDFEGTPQTRTDPTINFWWDDGISPMAGLPDDRFSVRWTGEVQATEAGRYTFSTFLDDVGKLTVCGEVLVNQEIYTRDPLSGEIELSAGQRCPIEIEMIEYVYGGKAQLWWQYGGYPRHVVPQAQLYP